MKNSLIIFSAIMFNLGFISSQWITQNPGTNMNINAVDFINSNTGWAAGDNSKIYRTTNGGTNWSVITVPGNPVNFTNSVSKDFAYLAGTRNAVYTTTNGGVNWYSTFLGLHYIIGDMDTNRGNIFIGAYLLNNNEDSILSADIFRSTNNGINWLGISSITMSVAGDPVHGVDVKLGMKFVSIDTGYIATVRGVYKTVNSGLNFVVLPNSPPSPKVVVAGSNSISTTTTFYTGVDKPNKLEIYKSTNGGNTWLLLSAIPDPDDSKQFTGISCPGNTDKIYITISNSAQGTNSAQDTSVYYSPNGGLNWYYQTLPVNNINIKSVQFTDGDTGFITGSGGTILKTTNGGAIAGIQQTSNEIPKLYELFQNYPNPFNPVTNIRFNVISGGNVKLTVYDPRGKEIAILINDELSSGSYTVDWSAAEYPSGIYFYRIETVHFTETKKMILIK